MSKKCKKYLTKSDSSDSSTNSDTSHNSTISTNSTKSDSSDSSTNSTDKCCKLLYSIGAWADNSVLEIKFIPSCGNIISWSVVANTLTPSNPTNINHWNMQSPITQSQFPIFPLKICTGDKFIFIFSNNLNTPNAFACAANIDGNIYKTFNNNITTYFNKITLETTTGYNIVNPSYSPTTDLVTRNIIDTMNYISVIPNNTSIYTLIWVI